MTCFHGGVSYLIRYVTEGNLCVCARARVCVRAGVQDVSSLFVFDEYTVENEAALFPTECALRTV